MMTSANPQQPKEALVLLVEDDWEIANLTLAALTKAGFRVAHARDKAGAMAQFSNDIPDLVILDVMLPGEDGFNILGTLRQTVDTPVIMLTARTELNDRIKGLMGGADDYVPKPFHTSELIARITAVLRRQQADPSEGEPVAAYTFDGWELKVRAREVYDPGGALILLTSAEFDILHALCRHDGDTLSRDRLVQLTQNRNVEPYDRSVDTLVSRIRRKLRQRNDGSDMIKTVRNAGYVFTPQVEAVYL